MKKTKVHLIPLFLLFILPGQAQPGPWKGAWITHTEDTAAKPSPLFRRVFEVNKPVKRATAFICGVGYHSSFVNGKPVSNGVLEQVYTNYAKRLQYSSYDITRSIVNGKNCIAVELGNGWYNVQSYNIWYFHRVAWRKSPRLLMDLVLEYKDGTQDTIGSDASWKTATGAGRFNSLLAGEIYDARMEQEGWKLPVFNDAAWLPAKLTTSPGGTLEPQLMPSVALIKTINPVSVARLDAYTWLYDLGENFAGVATLHVNGRRGDTITMEYGERLLNNGRLDAAQNAGMMFYAPGDLTFQTDQYILKGGGMEQYTPRFTYHGFRYVQLRVTDTSMRLTNASLQGKFYSADFTSAGSFSSSDTMLNKLYRAALQSYRSNFYNMPTDCPTREKMGWQADGVFIAESGLWNYRSAAAYRKWLDDIMDSQLANGLVAGVAPTDQARGYRWPVPPDSDYGPLWCSGEIVLPWYLYLYEGDTVSVRKSYAAAAKYMAYARTKASGHLYLTGLGDWLSIDSTFKGISSTAFYYNNARLMSRMADLLHIPADRSYYDQLADSIKMAFNERFFDKENKRYRDQTVTAISTAIFFDLCPEDAKEAVYQSLGALVRSKNHEVDYGLLGSKIVLPALTKAGLVDDAYHLLTNPAAGYGRMIASGSTTLWEDWDGKYSNNHPSFGAFVDWFYSGLAGIRPTERAPGFKAFTLQPVFPAALNEVSVHHDTKYGRIAVNWKRNGKAIDLTVTVPQQTTADVLIPGYERTLQPGVHRIKIDR